MATWPDTKSHNRFNLESAYIDLQRGYDQCLREHTWESIKKHICTCVNAINGKDHKFEVRSGQVPMKGQSCFCGEEQI